MSFQKTFFLLWNTKEDILKNVGILNSFGSHGLLLYTGLERNEGELTVTFFLCVCVDYPFKAHNIMYFMIKKYYDIKK